MKAVHLSMLLGVCMTPTNAFSSGRRPLQSNFQWPLYSQQCEDDAGPPYGDDTETFGPNGKYHDNSLAMAVLQNGECAGPLQRACESRGGRDVTPGVALAAYLEGPLQCGGKGWFCRILPDNNHHNPEDPRIDWNFNHCNRTDYGDVDGHCHGSDNDDTYYWWVRDHWFRNYAGRLHCCCDWGATVGVVARCDYRAPLREGENDECRDANEEHTGPGTGMTLGYEGQCSNLGLKPNPEPDAAQCWDVLNFAPGGGSGGLANWDYETAGQGANDGGNDDEQEDEDGNSTGGETPEQPEGSGDGDEGAPEQESEDGGEGQTSEGQTGEEQPEGSEDGSETNTGEDETGEDETGEGETGEGDNEQPEGSGDGPDGSKEEICHYCTSMESPSRDCVSALENVCEMDQSVGYCSPCIEGGEESRECQATVEDYLATICSGNDGESRPDDESEDGNEGQTGEGETGDSEEPQEHHTEEWHSDEEHQSGEEHHSDEWHSTEEMHSGEESHTESHSDEEEESHIEGRDRHGLVHVFRHARGGRGRRARGRG